ncbi:Nif3-like dinuclear metal center hexameric protein [bacterium]|nr:Nif3-like dinuclear metal center hexameric protein [bacterium]
MPIIADIIEQLNNWAPPELADDGDPIGLQIGDHRREAKKICVCVDTSPKIIDRAVELKADLIVAHHPLIYAPLKSLQAGDPVADRVTKLVKNDTALFVLHTNYDTTPGGINDVLAEKLGVTGCSPLTNRRQDTFYKVVTFVPEEAVEGVRNAMAEAGGGRIGQYTHCSFRVNGTGSFVPLPMADPYVGDVGKLSEVDEYRLEMICAESWLDSVIEAMIEKHPYDEVAYDVYQLANDPVIYGYGRVGILAKDTPLEEFAEKMRVILGVKYLKVEGNRTKPVRKVALLGGSGSSLFREAVVAGADVYVTGDTKHHDILDANSYGMAIIDAGHFETERPGMMALCEKLKSNYAGSGMDIEYIE